MENLTEEIEARIVNPDSPTVKGLLKMLQHKQLRD